MTETRTETPLGVVAGLVVGRKRDGRCIYSREGKRALVQLSLKRGASVARIAQQHGVNANLLRKWIDAFQGGGRAESRDAVSAAVTKLLPIVEIAPAPGAQRSAVSSTRAAPSVGSRDWGVIEIEVRGVKVRLHGEVSVRELEVVLGVVSRLP